MSRSPSARLLRGRVAAFVIAVTAAWPAVADARLIDLSDPAADVRDPVGTLAPVDTECHAGQVDLNRAPAQAIAEALGISTPTARRVSDAGPWLKGSDTPSIPGVGPQKAAEIAAKTCATQPQLPPAHPMACTSSSQVDLQAASAREITARLKLPAVTAQDLVDARPLPQDLHQVTTPRVRGLSTPKLDRLLDDHAVCVTPAPMLAGGSAYRWATPAGAQSSPVTATR